MEKTRTGGFSLIELMVTLGVASILIGILAPNMRVFLLNNQLSNGVNDMLHSIQVARTEAIKRQPPPGAGVVVCGTADPTGPDTALSCDYATFKAWFVFVDSNGNWQHDANEPVIERHGLLDASMFVKTDPNARIVSFAASGFANVAGARVPMQTLVLCDSRGVKQISGTSTTARALFISTTGRARAASAWNDVKNVALPKVVGGNCP